MTLDYLDLLSDLPYLYPGIGHIKRVKLGELRTGGDNVGLLYYNAMLFLLQASKSDLVSMIESEATKNLVKGLTEKSDVTVYDIVALVPSIRGALYETLSYYLEENVTYDERSRTFITFKKERKDSEPMVVGSITRDNYDEFRDVVLQMNHLSFDKKQDVVKTDNDELLKKWKYAEQMDNDLQNKSSTEDASIGNVISKLCASGIGISFENVWDLTVYQAYDQFAQLGYLHGIHLSERIYTIHGGDNFNFGSWMESLHRQIPQKG